MRLTDHFRQRLTAYFRELRASAEADFPQAHGLVFLTLFGLFLGLRVISFLWSFFLPPDRLGSFWSDRWPRSGKRLVWWAGCALVALGVLCLILSDAVVQGWWSNTLDAFGVGFIVGGIVDVLAITGLNSVMTGEQAELETARRENNSLVEGFLTYARNAPPEESCENAIEACLMDWQISPLDEPLKDQLHHFVRSLDGVDHERISRDFGRYNYMRLRGGSGSDPCPCGSGRNYWPCHFDKNGRWPNNRHDPGLQARMQDRTRLGD